MIGGIIIYERFSYPVKILFNNFCKSIAAHIGTPPAQLAITYWFHYNLNVEYQWHPTLYTDLRNKAKFHKVIDYVVQKLSGAQTCSIVLEIYNKVNIKVFAMFAQC